MAQDAPARTVRLVAMAACRYAGGTAQRLWATRITLSGAWILAVEPPRVGEMLELTLHPLGLAALPSIQARVMKAQIDFEAAEKNGFEVSFVNLAEETLDLLVSAVIGIDEMRKKAPAFAERRGALRVKTNLTALARTPDGPHHGIIADLSLTGALLSLPRDAPESSLARGAALTLEVKLSDAAESLELAGRIAWSTLVAGQRLAGIQFENVSSASRMRIQETILDALAGIVN
ncbi:MAG TPA: PilZ domain-containing protein [Polyangiaceae bacterium]|nr:PilZ domain-containing protein [Polyangiaceae bacterium]